jgi:hypothetical protein
MSGGTTAPSLIGIIIGIGLIFGAIFIGLPILKTIAGLAATAVKHPGIAFGTIVVVLFLIAFAMGAV